MKLAEAVQGLRRLQMPKLDDIQIELQYARHSCKAVGIVEAISPGQAPYIYSKAALIESRDGIPDLFSLALEKISAKCPIDTDHIEEQLLNYEGELVLMPEPQGFPYSLDELYEMLGEDPDNLMDTPLEWFVIALGGNLEWEHLEILVERYPIWNVSLEELPGDGDLDWPKFKKALNRNGLEEFAAAFQVIWHDTGNLYLDFSPFGDDAWDWELPEFGLEGVQLLIEQYTMAQPLLDGFQAAQERIRQAPEIYREMVKIMKRCLKESKPQAKTLPEVFA